MLLRHIEAHARELLVQLARRVAAVVREKEIFLVLLVQPLDELRHARQDAVAVVDDAIHIADEALFLVEIDRSAHVDFSFVSSFCLVCFPVISLKGMDFYIFSVKSTISRR